MDSTEDSRVTEISTWTEQQKGKAGDMTVRPFKEWLHLSYEEDLGQRGVKQGREVTQQQREEESWYVRAL